MRRKILMNLLISLGLILSTAVGFEAAAQKIKTETFTGMCDASAAVALGENEFLVANDEDNNLRVFNLNTPNEPQILGLSEIYKGVIFDGEDLEIDLEGAARIGDRIFWIGSHSTSKKGNFRAARHRLFAVQISRAASGKYNAVAAGQIYTNLIAEIEQDARFNDFKIKEAKAIKPKDTGGLSIEGLAAAPDGSLLIAFRNPLRGGQIKDGFLIGGKALIVKLLNPTEVIKGAAARFDAPVELDLGGYGIRSLEYNAAKENFFIVAGPYHANEQTPREVNRIYTWSGKPKDTPKLEKNFNLTEFNIEAAFFFPSSENNAWLFSDDGNTCRRDNESFRAILQKF